MSMASKAHLSPFYKITVFFGTWKPRIQYKTQNLKTKGKTPNFFPLKAFYSVLQILGWNSLNQIIQVIPRFSTPTKLRFHSSTNLIPKCTQPFRYVKLKISLLKSTAKLPEQVH